MLTNPFGKSNSKVQKILKLADQLSLSLRENVELIDSDEAKVTFLSESGYVIEGDFDFDNLELSDIKVTTSDIFEDSEMFDSIVSEKITNVLGALLEDNRKEASSRFNGILRLWETRSKYDRVMLRLNERRERFNLYAPVVDSEQFAVLNELKPQLTSFLKENRDEVVKIKEIINSIKLSNTVAKAFNLPAVSVEELHESTFEVRDRRFDSVYDIVCRQELIKKDLMENKKHFNSLWLNSKELNSLVEFIGRKNDKGLTEALASVIHENPYFALATKKQLFELFENSISFNETVAISKKEIKEFVNKIYEAKSEVKNVIVENLNDKYGINIQNLKMTPSFSDLGKTQKVIFESLQKIAPRGSALKSALNDFSKILGIHSGVDVIDLNEWIVDLFVDCDFTESINETSLLNYMNFDKVAGDLTKIGEVLKMIQAGLGGEVMPEDGQYEADGSAEEDAMSAMDGGEEEEAEEMGDEEEMDDEEEMGDEEMPEQSPEEAAEGAQEDMEGEQGMSDDAQEGDEEPEGQMEEDEFMSYLEDLEGLIDSLKSNMGEASENDEEEEGEDDDMPEEADEEENETPEEEMGEEDNEEDEEEESIIKKKKSPFPPKE